MPQISKETIRKVKETAKISDLFESYGSRIKHKGTSRARAFCPFCADFTSRNPGCAIDDDAGFFHCFVCGRGGDIIDAVREHDDSTFNEAVETLAKQYNVPIKYDDGNDEEVESRKRRLSECLKKANEIFIAQRNCPDFSSFVEKRHLTQSAIDEFEFGISRDIFWRKAVERLRETFTEDEIVGCGLCYKTDDGELVMRMRDRITIPIYAANNRLIGFGGRDITGHAPAKYLNSPDTALFDKSSVLFGMNKARKEIRRRKSVIICEGYMDTIALQMHGFGNAVGAMGTAVGTRNLRLLSRMADTIYISLDADEAGTNAARRIIDNLPKGFTADVKVVRIPRSIAKDPDEFFNQAGRTESDFQKLLDSAQPIHMFCIDRVIEQEVKTIDAAYSSVGKDEKMSDEVQITVSNARAEARRKATNLVAPIYSKLDAQNRKQMADRLTESIRLVESYDDIDAEWRAASHGAERRKEEKDFESRVLRNGPISSSETADEDSLIAALYWHPEIRQAIRDEIPDASSILTSDTRRAIYAKLDGALSKGRTPAEATDTFNNQESAEFARIIAEPSVEGYKEDVGKHVVDELSRKLKVKSLQHRLQEVSESPMPDLMEILRLKQELSKIRDSE